MQAKVKQHRFDWCKRSAAVCRASSSSIVYKKLVDWHDDDDDVLLVVLTWVLKLRQHRLICLTAAMTGRKYSLYNTNTNLKTKCLPATSSCQHSDQTLPVPHLPAWKFCFCTYNSPWRIMAFHQESNYISHPISKWIFDDEVGKLNTDAQLHSYSSIVVVAVVENFLFFQVSCLWLLAQNDSTSCVFQHFAE